MKAIIVAGGKGERMGSLTRTLPKVMLPVQGKPLLELQIRWLRSQGFRHIFLALGYRAEDIRAYFQDGKKLGVRIEYSVEKKPLGTAGAVKKLQHKLRESFLVVYGDILIRIPLKPVLAVHAKARKRKDYYGTLVLQHSDHPQDSDLVQWGENSFITRFINKPHRTAPHTDLSNAAVYVLHPRIFGLIPPGRSTDFAHDIFPNVLSRHGKLHGYITKDLLHDIGTPERYARVAQEKTK